MAEAAGAGARVHYEAAALAAVSRLADPPAPEAILAGAFTPEILAAWLAEGGAGRTPPAPASSACSSRS